MSKKKLIVVLAAALAVTAMAVPAMAFNAPQPGDFFYEGYDFAAKLGSGAPGATVGLAGAAAAGFFLFKQQILPAAGSALGAIVIANAAKMVTAMGYLF